MAITTPLSLLFLFSLLTAVQPKPLPGSTPYLSPTTLFPNYQKMLSIFKIYIHTPPKPFTAAFSMPPESLFHSSLLQSSFVTQNPKEAHLFFVPFSDLSTRSLARLVRELRQSFPYWNSSLGADHFFLSRSGIEYTSDRNIVELKKNSVQISCFPTTSGNFIPHKDITLPPVNPSPIELPHAPTNGTTAFLGYMKLDSRVKSTWSFVDELIDDPEFVIESEPSDGMGRIRSSKYCLFMYDGDVSWMVEALASGCVPAVITDRPIQDLPLMDVLRWSEIAVVVGTGGGVKGLKAVLGGISEDRYERMRELGVTASRHLVWNAAPQPYDAFHMVMYQLWLRRHTIRYARRELV